MQPRMGVHRTFEEVLTLFLRDNGHLEIEPTADASSNRVTAYFMPNQARMKDDATLGFLERMARAPCILEVYQDAPTPRDLLRCFVKFRLLSERMGDEPSPTVRNDKPADISAHLEIEVEMDIETTPRSEEPSSPLDYEDDDPKAPLLRLPELWMICTEAPTPISSMGPHPMDGWPNGFYRLGDRWPIRIVVLPDLPETGVTLALRLMGRGPVLKTALDELTKRSFKSEAWRARDRNLMDILKKPEMPPPSPPSKKIPVEPTKDMHTEAHDAGRQEGREEALIPFVVLLSERLGRPLTDREQEMVRRRLRATGAKALWTTVAGLEASGLEAWLRTPGA